MTRSKSPFRDFAEKLKKIRKKPLSEKQVEEINSILEKIEDKDNSEMDYWKDDRKIAINPNRIGSDENMDEQRIY